MFPTKWLQLGHGGACFFGRWGETCLKHGQVTGSRPQTIYDISKETLRTKISGIYVDTSTVTDGKVLKQTTKISIDISTSIP